MRKTLYPHQEKAIDLLRESLKSGKKRPLLQAPTGAGKTVISAAIVAGALAKGKKVMFTVPALSLIDQTVERFCEEGINDIGVIQGNHQMTNYLSRVQVASIQTLKNRPLPKADIVIVDEAHKLFDFYSSWMTMDEWRNVPFVGLSATPWTKGLGVLYDDLLISTTTEELIKTGHLSPFKVFAPSHPDLKGVRTVAGDFHEGDLSEAMTKGSLVADIVATWRARAEGLPTLVFAVDIAHARRVKAQFESEGVSCGYVDANTDIRERKELAGQFQSGLVDVVVSVGTLTTGIDWDVRCIILARPTKSEMLFTQIIGRGLRTAPGKDHCLILDHSDTHLRLGFVTDIRHDRLSDGKTRVAGEREPVLPKECPKCSYLKSPRQPVCPSCGFKAEIVCTVQTKAGELAELREGKKTSASMFEKQEWYSMLISIQRARGYKSGWTANQYRQKFGVWPTRLQDYALPPSPEVVNYVKSQMIRYAKGRSKATQAIAAE